ncbi:polysaccharide deacetylase family protein [Hyalangium sp.]|uniref:polysaccharide deacetylase family protein n=1 Tax=Hyalangium sp. TaxID=2028555 RepID=UPI002D4DD6E9|nr:polysaccharide deacetylase family protein [Hyalangium sp.]HYH96682.1 polysaccharide deacetylase family protein [Hyalangium sp.]
MRPLPLPPVRWHRRGLVLSLSVLSLLLGLACQGLGEVPTPEDSLRESAEALILAPGQVIVSLHFDDSLASQAEAGPLLAARGMRGTFYANSGRVGTPGSLTYEQLRQFQAAGHEVGGHKISHPRLTTLGAAAQRQEVCGDRLALLNAGLQVKSFAYPFGDADSGTRQLLIDCGYNSGRESGGLRTPGSCSSSPYAEPVPPRDAYAIRTHGSVTRDWTLSYLQNLVLRAESAGGGWVPIVFHQISPTTCSTSETYCISRSTFIAFLDWLAPRTSRGTVVRTVDEVIGGPPQPPPSGTPPPPTQLLINPSLVSE